VERRNVTGSPEGTLELVPAGAAGDGSQRTAVFLRAIADLDLAGLSFSVTSASNSQLQFTASDQPPSISDTGVAGSLGLAWLSGWSARAGQSVSRCPPMPQAMGTTWFWISDRRGVSRSLKAKPLQPAELAACFSPQRKLWVHGWKQQARVARRHKRLAEKTCSVPSEASFPTNLYVARCAGLVAFVPDPQLALWAK
jgi:hypothetical protein